MLLTWSSNLSPNISSIIVVDYYRKVTVGTATSIASTIEILTTVATEAASAN